MGTIITGESFGPYNNQGDQYARKGGMSCTNTSGNIVNGIFSGTKGFSGNFNRVLDSGLTSFYVEWRGQPYGNNNSAFSLYNSVTAATKLWFNFNSNRGGVDIFTGSSTVLWHSPNNIYTTSETGWWGFGGTLSASSGAVYLRYGNQVLYSQTGINTTGDDSTTVFDTMSWGLIHGNGFQLIQDISICGDSFNGDTLFYQSSPTANGTTNNFTPESGTNIGNVDSSTFQTSNYNYSSTVGNKEFYKWGSPPSGTILAVILGLYMWQDSGGGTRQIEHAVSNGTTEYDGSSIVMGSNSPIYYTKTYDQNPTTSAAWQQSDFTASSGYTELGVKLVA